MKNKCKKEIQNWWRKDRDRRNNKK